MDGTVIARAVEKVAETHRDKSHSEQSFPIHLESVTSENPSQTPQLRFRSAEGGTPNPMNRPS